jgi:hypothetical protein
MKTLLATIAFLFISNLHAQEMDKSFTLNKEKIIVKGMQTGEKKLTTPDGAIEQQVYKIADGIFSTYYLQFLKGKIISISKKTTPVKDLDLSTADIGDMGDGLLMITIKNLNYAMTAEHTTWSKDTEKTIIKTYNISYKVKTEEEAKRIIEELKEAQK